MSLGNTFESDLAKLVFQATPIANIADNAVSGALTNLYVALHSADPGEAGTQATSEVSYTGPYARVAVGRSGSGWAESGGVISPVANVDFPPCTGGSVTATYFSVGVASSGATKLLVSGTVTPNISISSGVTPRLTTGTTITFD